MKMLTRPRVTGFTLIEMVISIVIISIALVAVLGVMNRTTAKSGDPMLTHQANSIAHAYMEEVMLRPFCDPDYIAGLTNSCPADCSSNACSSGCGGSVFDATESRAVFDDVCDYNNLTHTGARNQISPGTVISGLENYVITVSVDDTANLNTLLGGAGQAVLITVDVVHSTRPDIAVSLNAYRANY